MPRVNIYIRKEDEAKWKAIENRADWLHLMIDAYGDDPVFKFAAMLGHENKKLAHLIKHPEDSKLYGLSALVDDGVEISEYESLTKTTYPKILKEIKKANELSNKKGRNK